MDSKRRCGWGFENGDELYIRYHDAEWGVPVHDDKKLFEVLVLQSTQAGLSWYIVLHKRDSYRNAFDGFSPKKVARYDARKVGALLENRGIIRNRLKIEAAVNNAKHFLEVQKEFGSFDSYIWRFVPNGRPIRNRWTTVRQAPARTRESDAMSADLKRRGFKFVGATICYAYMQATGMVNDHITSCFRYREV